MSALQILSSINEELVYIKNLVSKDLLNDTIIFELEQKAYKQVLSGYQVFLLWIWPRNSLLVTENPEHCVYVCVWEEKNSKSWNHCDADLDLCLVYVQVTGVIDFDKTSGEHTAPRIVHGICDEVEENSTFYLSRCVALSQGNWSEDVPIDVGVVGPSLMSSKISMRACQTSWTRYTKSFLSEWVREEIMITAWEVENFAMGLWQEPVSNTNNHQST